MVAITFDDGPDGSCTAGVLDALAETKAPATFFLVGAFVDEGQNDALVARMLREGHTLAVHGYYHFGVRRVFFSDLTAIDLRRASDSITRALHRAGQTPPAITYYRPPFGLMTNATQRGATLAGLSLVKWTVSVQDWPRWRERDDIVNPILDTVQAGDVIVLHDGNEFGPSMTPVCRNHPALADAVRALVPALRAKGLEPAPLADVLQAGAPDSTNRTAQR